MDIGLIVDVETTGIDPYKDEIIELGLVAFKVESSSPPSIFQVYSGIQEPSIPIPQEITKITGISHRDVIGEKIDWSIVAALCKRASIAIAHNAIFDIGFLAKIAELEECNVHWACSLRHIDWHHHGFNTKSLHYLAADHGFLNPFAHRAVFDCATTFKLIQPYFQELLKNSYENEYQMIAIAAPYIMKESLRERGYFWDGVDRVWKKQIFSYQLEAEREFLEKKIYSGSSKHKEKKIPPLSLKNSAKKK